MPAPHPRDRAAECGPAAPVHRWVPQPLGRDVAAAIERLARSDDVRHVAVMPDVHLAREVCVGVAAATDHLLYPDAVGGDIGCGMAAMAFDGPADRLASDAALAARVLLGLGRAVPIMRHGVATQPEFPPELAETPLSDDRLTALARRDSRVQLGTLGRGNHFLELQRDEADDRLWLMVHSGSRAMGQAIRAHHLARARKSATGLLLLDARSPDGVAYLHDVDWARGYARASRRIMAMAAAGVIADVLGTAGMTATYFDCDHNHVARERHGDADLWVHRKGAIPAGDGAAGITPGSMGTESYHVEGRGCPESLRSSAHGAGRAMSRDEARRRVTPRELGRQMQSVWYDHRTEASLREEAPAAYKDIRAVFRAQRDLTRITRRLRPVLSLKGR